MPIASHKDYPDMKILITGGGTLVPIDPVRNIRNNSTGRFAAKLATAALEAGAEVIYLAAGDSKSPFSLTLDYHRNANFENQLARLKQLDQFSKQFHGHYYEYRYHNFSEYQALLKELTIEKEPEIVILAAAVSDYMVSNYAHEKIRSSEQLTIQLKPAPKLIHSIKKWLPETFLVGFKLLVDASDAELCDAAIKSIRENNADLIVANDLTSIQQGKHEILLVEKTGAFQKYTENLANTVIERSLQR
jgi:phosphopantothenate--cysteine ligase